VVVDGNDGVAVYLEAKRAVARARRGEGPTLIEALTYRLGPHTTSDDPRRYRDPAEEKAARAKDPIPRLREALVAEGWWSEAEEEALLAKLEAELEAALAEADAAPPPKPEEIVLEVYAEPGPDQLEALRALRQGKPVEALWLES
jgi:pyruvate dehydrogenase E1 component alpha subunit